jgi:predicted DNA-binding transcriptional regulator AlpA
MSRAPAPKPIRGYAPRGMRLEAAAAWVGLGRTKFLEMVADGRMPKGKTVDSCRVWDRFQLDEAFDALPDEAGDPSNAKTGWEAFA